MSSGGNIWDELWEDEERYGIDEDDQFPAWMNKDAIIFLIDAQEAMFEEVADKPSNLSWQTDDGEIPFENAVKCATAALSDKIISSDTDLVGVCFFGTRENKNPNNFDNIYVFQGYLLSSSSDN